MLSMKGKYALKALCELARLAPGQIAASSDISARNGISKKFLDTILGDLRAAGIVATRKGRSGGYFLARPADLVSVGEVLRLIDGPLAPIACASRTAYAPCTDCGDPAACAVRATMLEVRDAIARVLDGKTLRDIALIGPAALMAAG
ncbi:RrF2 family transcriptional regulator [Paragemmobacter straminiformis]|uniref:Rrf2 family transcriptional regulator n=1 Tax=Paragemmobacter straminiformis TaxID=2045119 RepID=A0A842IBW3_9RHOB|nr:Rrf2 family transcriptional regulator [Gemmobacter straminiformis]MBC2836837.1 Rrf2 family transcriptional regulator [Gemmobacter straminiformis]